jgi:hypothetical protein
MNTQREFVHVSFLPSQVEDPDLWVWNTSAKARLGIGLVFAVTVATSRTAPHVSRLRDCSRFTRSFTLQTHADSQSMRSNVFEFTCFIKTSDWECHLSSSRHVAFFLSETTNDNYTQWSPSVGISTKVPDARQ